jgi:hypothetical protein
MSLDPSNPRKTKRALNDLAFDPIQRSCLPRRAVSIVLRRVDRGLPRRSMDRVRSFVL